MTGIGRNLHQRVSAGIDQIDLAVGVTIGGGAEVTISVSASLATHWLLPRLPSSSACTRLRLPALLNHVRAGRFSRTTPSCRRPGC